MAEIRGTSGVLQIGVTTAVTVAKVTDFSVRVERSRIYTQAKGDEWQKSVKGLGKWSASGTCILDYNEASQTTVRDNLISGTAATIGADVACVFLPGGAVAGEKKLSGNGVITNFELTSPAVDDTTPAQFSFEIEGNGAIAEASAG